MLTLARFATQAISRLPGTTCQSYSGAARVTCLPARIRCQWPGQSIPSREREFTLAVIFLFSLNNVDATSTGNANSREIGVSNRRAIASKKRIFSRGTMLVMEKESR